MITTVDFKTIFKIWSEYLWPNRLSNIQPHSAMLMSGHYELKNFNYTPTFFIYKVDGIIAGCNSGHKCCDNTYRSRGLYVFPEFRKKGYGKELLVATINQGIKENTRYIWSYPRYESWSTYESAGFKLASDWKKDETGTNALCVYEIDRSGWSSNL